MGDRLNILDLIFYSFNSLRQRKIRSWLTVLGIVVGITAIVVLIGLVQGLRAHFNEQISIFGARSIVVLPVNVQSGAMAGSSWLPSNGKLYMKDYERIKKIPDIESITPVITGRTTIGFKDKEITTSVLGIEPMFKETAGSMEINKGRFLQSNDQKSVVIGATIANDTFGEEVPLSSTLFISNRPYRVVGILNKSGSSFTNLDSGIFIQLDEAREIFADVLSDKEIQIIRLTVKEGSNITEIADQIEYEMLAAHRVTEDNKDFSVITSDFINQQLDQVTGILSIFLGGVASIALLVGGVGIANTMFMSVAERKREIGILKSIGAREEEILRLFLVESSIIGFAGGFFGLVLAYILSYLITFLSGVTVIIDPSIVIGAILFSATVGVISGVFPAKQAAELDPVEALTG
ncbi:MacB-like periplasmic core domain protein [Candidatus Bilamarchaeum dharawalense]|uniref:MacB-like periplasmic core domain protein n=1 Tax=Candidatus Bilamarchaeum dharawalense TaxID=2885759 RepID=A0A5E4LNR0_9ARCH|nr:MacB-like periplasmic core domain protein [Candidatus Bilamarchaeum dharawalense]